MSKTVYEKEITKEEFKLHYVGQGLYKIQYFETEAKKYGVQRAVPFTQLKNLKFGIPILLARYIPTQYKGNKKIKPQAEIFGYFTINGISHNLPKPTTEQLTEKLDIIKVDNTSSSVSRACGSYSIQNTTYINDSLSDLKSKIEELFCEHKNSKLLKEADGKYICNCKSKKCESCVEPTDCIDGKHTCCTSINYTAINTYKWFINGKYYPLTSFILSPAKFSRGIQTVKIKDLSLKRQSKTQSALIWLYNYRQRHYLPKAMKQRLEKNSTDSFKNAF